MIAALTAKLLALGVPARLARPLLMAGGIIIAAIVIILIWSIWLARHDAAVVRQHEAASNAAVAEAARKADAELAETRRSDDARTHEENAELKRTINAHDPAQSAPISAARRAFIECVRLQQSARQAGRAAPACD